MQRISRSVRRNSRAAFRTSRRIIKPPGILQRTQCEVLLALSQVLHKFLLASWAPLTNHQSHDCQKEEKGAQVARIILLQTINQAALTVGRKRPDAYIVRLCCTILAPR